MLEELDYDVAHSQLHISTLLSGQGQRDYPVLLHEALTSGTADTLAEALRAHRRLARVTPRRRPSGEVSLVNAPKTAADTLAEGEFNRYYIRAVCRRAVEDRIPFVIVYRAKPVHTPRSQSEEVLERTLDPVALLRDLRSHTGEATELGVPGGPNSGISVRLP